MYKATLGFLAVASAGQIYDDSHIQEAAALYDEVNMLTVKMTPLAEKKIEAAWGPFEQAADNYKIDSHIAVLANKDLKNLLKAPQA